MEFQQRQEVKIRYRLAPLLFFLSSPAAAAAAAAAAL